VQYSISSKSPLGLIFVDLNKAYDRVDRNTLWEDMAEKMHIPKCLIRIIRNMYVNNKGVVCVKG
jgi:Reverse transcriptase (RNA-dependent DNA polymerase).